MKQARDWYKNLVMHVSDKKRKKKKLCPEIEKDLTAQ